MEQHQHRFYCHIQSMERGAFGTARLGGGDLKGCTSQRAETAQGVLTRIYSGELEAHRCSRIWVDSLTAFQPPISLASARSEAGSSRKAPASFTSSRRAVRRLPPDSKTLALSASIVKRLFRSGVRSRNQVARMSHSVDAYECAQLPAVSLILPDDTLLPSDLNKSPKADRHKLLPDRVEKLRVHRDSLYPHFSQRSLARTCLIDKSPRHGGPLTRARLGAPAFPRTRQ